jgi:uncharacterized protein (DUF1330 family)
MAAYLYVNLEVTDPVAYEAYRRDVPPLIAAHGGRYLARGGTAELLEGDAVLHRQVILEFPDMASLKAFYADPAYAPLKRLRQQAARGALVAVEGL